ncbi:hypothetical protein TNCV_3371561 [Trichonephila clavipes]|nr:hypothetical protein TNCV_3371561 [Trichonephila clavipes]
MASNQDLTNIMELSLPSSNESTRPGTPTETNCERLISIKNDIEKFSIVVENTKADLRPLLSSMESLKMILPYWTTTEGLEEYQRLRQLAERHKFLISYYHGTANREVTHQFHSGFPRPVHSNKSWFSSDSHVNLLRPTTTSSTTSASRQSGRCLLPIKEPHSVVPLNHVKFRPCQ